MEEDREALKKRLVDSGAWSATGPEVRPDLPANADKGLVDFNSGLTHSLAGAGGAHLGSDVTGGFAKRAISGLTKAGLAVGGAVGLSPFATDLQDQLDERWPDKTLPWSDATAPNLSEFFGNRARTHGMNAAINTAAGVRLGVGAGTVGLGAALAGPAGLPEMGLAGLLGYGAHLQKQAYGENMDKREQDLRGHEMWKPQNSKSPEFDQLRNEPSEAYQALNHPFGRTKP